MGRSSIELGGGYRITALDERNWKLQHLHEPRETRSRTRRAGARWYDTGNYFQSLGSALAHVHERRMRDEGVPDETLGCAMSRAEAIRDELMGACK